ncbi:biotin/lipoyl-binding protein [Spirulina sp. CCNP1310]|uniref:biotin/lipoyl-binding protein n=1 Tax=Spirulina sp. CCNP1310 TaxID=3110249 RepID=UPI002B1F4690|nr:biotin/lipoyl-binding protein [Spirulina sp. CCNP1310]MEA5420307.1 biotin/lipoyl-binding protein [Spirulina sp. CCNP1310]
MTMALRQYLLGLCLGGLVACSSGTEAPPEGRGRGEGGPIAVTVAPVSTGVLKDPVEYLGTLAPQRTVSLRAQAEGRLLNLTGEVGDRLTQGQLIARLDDSLFNTATSQARAQLDTLAAELAQGRVQVEHIDTPRAKATGILGSSTGLH